MRYHETDYPLEVIKGDTFECMIQIESEDEPMTTEDLSHVYFSSKALNITKELVYDSEEEAFLLSFTSNETKAFEEGSHSYDLTIYTVGSAKKTCIYNNLVHVLPKDNEVT